MKGRKPDTSCCHNYWPAAETCSLHAGRRRRLVMSAVRPRGTEKKIEKKQQEHHRLDSCISAVPSRAVGWLIALHVLLVVFVSHWLCLSFAGLCRSSPPPARRRPRLLQILAFLPSCWSARLPPAADRESLVPGSVGVEVVCCDGGSERKRVPGPVQKGDTGKTTQKRTPDDGLIGPWRRPLAARPREKGGKAQRDESASRRARKLDASWRQTGCRCSREERAPWRPRALAPPANRRPALDGFARCVTVQRDARGGLHEQWRARRLSSRFLLFPFPMVVSCWMLGVGCWVGVNSGCSVVACTCLPLRASRDLLQSQIHPSTHLALDGDGKSFKLFAGQGRRCRARRRQRAPAAMTVLPTATSRGGAHGTGELVAVTGDTRKRVEQRLG